MNLIIRAKKTPPENIKIEKNHNKNVSFINSNQLLCDFPQTEKKQRKKYIFNTMKMVNAEDNLNRNFLSLNFRTFIVLDGNPFIVSSSPLFLSAHDI